MRVGSPHKCFLLLCVVSIYSHRIAITGRNNGIEAVMNILTPIETYGICAGQAVQFPPLWFQCSGCILIAPALVNIDGMAVFTVVKPALKICVAIGRTICWRNVADLKSFPQLSPEQVMEALLS